MARIYAGGQVIPVSAPRLCGNEKKYLAECIDSGWLGYAGPFVSRFERECALTFGRKYAIATSSGTTALHTAVAALGVEEYDEVIVPTFTFMSCASAVLYQGARPVFVDCNDTDWNIDVTKIEAAITRRTKAIMVAHIYGLPVDMDPVLALAKKYELSVIEDAAEVHGQRYGHRLCGSMGDISIFSFFGNKNIACGEGGMVLTDREDLALACRDLSNMSPDPGRRYRHLRVSWNYRMSNLHAAVGLAQLEQLPITLRTKRHNGLLYTQLLQDQPDLQLPLTCNAHADNCYWVYPLVSHKHIGSELIEKLAARDVEARPFFYPLHRQSAIRFPQFNPSLPVAEYAAEHGIYLPSGATLTKSAVERVVEILKEIL